MQIDFTKHIEQILLLGKRTVTLGPRLTEETGTTNVKGDKTIGMDTQVENAILDYVREHDLPVAIFSEEIGSVVYHPAPTHLLVFDPLDGSTNYKLGKNLLPHGLLIACYEGLAPQLRDVVASGAIEYNADLGWIFDGQQTRSFDGKPTRLDTPWVINQSTSVYLDLYYPEAYRTFAPLAGQVHIRWNGSNVSSLAYTLAEVSALMGACLMRPEEIGAMVSLIKGAGGMAVDLSGQNLGKKLFSINDTYPILAGNRAVVDFCIKLLNP